MYEEVKNDQNPEEEEMVKAAENQAKYKFKYLKGVLQKKNEKKQKKMLRDR